MRFDPRQVLLLAARMSLELEHYNNMKLTITTIQLKLLHFFIAQTRQHFIQYVVCPFLFCVRNDAQALQRFDPRVNED